MISEQHIKRGEKEAKVGCPKKETNDDNQFNCLTLQEQNIGGYANGEGWLERNTDHLKK